jgi:Tfp pilus assembly protein PilW
MPAIARRGLHGRIGRPGFSLVEMLVAITLTLAVFAITLPFVRAQSRALGANAGRLDAEQVARYAQRAIDGDLRLATADGIGQPVIVQAAPMAISFNVNLIAPDTTDPNALTIEAGAATTLTESWRLSGAAALPLVAKVYPTVDYSTAAGTISRNETVSYFLRPDTVSGRGHHA